MGSAARGWGRWDFASGVAHDPYRKLYHPAGCAGKRDGGGDSRCRFLGYARNDMGYARNDTNLTGLASAPVGV